MSRGLAFSALSEEMATVLRVMDNRLVVVRVPHPRRDEVSLINVDAT
jgi:hypothetical protein